MSYMVSTMPGAGKSAMNKRVNMPLLMEWISRVVKLWKHQGPFEFNTVCVMILPLSSKTLLNRVEKNI